jgi:hypothetical protein
VNAHGTMVAVAKVDYQIACQQPLDIWNNLLLKHKLTMLPSIRQNRRVYDLWLYYPSCYQGTIEVLP